MHVIKCSSMQHVSLLHPLAHFETRVSEEGMLSLLHENILNRKEKKEGTICGGKRHVILPSQNHLKLKKRGCGGGHPVLATERMEEEGGGENSEIAPIH